MLENPVRLINRLPRTVRVLLAGSFVNKAGTFILPYLTLVLSRELHLTARQVALLLFAYAAGSLVSILVGGVLTDRLGRRHTLLLSLFGSGALAVALAAAPSVPLFVGLLVALGFLADLYRPASSAVISDALPSSQRAVGFAAVRMAVNLGFAFGMALGGFIADWHWRALFLGDGLTTLAFGLMVYFFVPETAPGAAVAADPSAGASSPWTDRVFLQSMVASLASCLIFFNFLTTLPLTITLGAGYPARLYGLLVAVNGLLIAAFEVSAAQALRRFRRLRVAALGVVVAGLGFGLTGLVLHWSWFLFTLLLWTAGEILVSPQQQAFIADWSPPNARGRYMSLFQATWSLGFALNPLIFVPLHARLGDRLFWPVMLVVALPGAAVLLRLDRLADRPELLRGAAGVPSAGPATYA